MTPFVHRIFSHRAHIEHAFLIKAYCLKDAEAETILWRHLNFWTDQFFDISRIKKCSYVKIVRFKLLWQYSIVARKYGRHFIAMLIGIN